jgi:predicted small metal-binding protein
VIYFAVCAIKYKYEKNLLLFMAEDEYQELIHCIHFGDTAQACGFKVKAKTEEEVMKHAEMHEKEAHGKELTPEDEKKIKSNIKTVKN